jgi:hypothetical protein
MEISINIGEMKDGVYIIDDFYFTAFTLLGSKVTPCFESSGLQTYSTDEFKAQFTQMMEEFKQYFAQHQSSDNGVKIDEFAKKEDKQLNEKLELLKTYGYENADTLDFDINNLSIDELKIKLEELKSNEGKSKDFSLNLMEMVEEIEIALSEKKFVDAWDYETSQYWFMDLQDNEVIAVDRKDHYRLYGLPISMNEDKIVIDFENCKRKKTKYEDFQDGTDLENLNFENAITNMATHFKEKTDTLITEKSTLDSTYTALKTDYDSIKPKYDSYVKSEQDSINAQIKADKDAVFTRFEKDLGEIEEFKKLKEKSNDFDAETLTKECLFILDKKNVTTKFTKENKSVKLPVVNEKVKTYYGGLLTRQEN